MKRKIIAFLASSVAILSLVGLVYFVKPATLDVQPLSTAISGNLIHIIGPQILLDRLRGIAGRDRCGVLIDYGDGLASNVMGGRPCWEMLSHQYDNPGIYNVHVSTFHPTPTDTMVADDQYAITVKIQ